MKRWQLVLGIVGFIAIVVVVTATFIPQATPQYDVAVDFVLAAGKGDNESALRQLSPELQAWVSANCPAGVAQCVDDYTPADWGNFLNAVFRRAQPDGNDAWDILMLATYAENQGFSGVCIYVRTERVTGDVWHVTRWSGWMSCDEPNAGLADLISDPTVPNRAP